MNMDEFPVGVGRAEIGIDIVLVLVFEIPFWFSRVFAADHEALTGSRLWTDVRIQAVICTTNDHRKDLELFDRQLAFAVVELTHPQIPLLWHYRKIGSKHLADSA